MQEIMCRILCEKKMTKQRDNQGFQMSDVLRVKSVGIPFEIDFFGWFSNDRQTFISCLVFNRHLPNPHTEWINGFCLRIFSVCLVISFRNGTECIHTSKTISGTKERISANSLFSHYRNH